MLFDFVYSTTSGGFNFSRVPVNKSKMLRRSFKNIQKLYSIRSFRTSTYFNSRNQNPPDENDELSSSVSTRFQVFKDSSVGVIFDIEEERAKRQLELDRGIVDEEADLTDLPSIYDDLNINRK